MFPSTATASFIFVHVLFNFIEKGVGKAQPQFDPQAPFPAFPPTNGLQRMTDECERELRGYYKPAGSPNNIEKANTPSGPGECAIKCFQNPDCQFWSYGGYPGSPSEPLHTCFLKRNQTGVEINSAWQSGNKACGRGGGNSFTGPRPINWNNGNPRGAGGNGFPGPRPITNVQTPGHPWMWGQGWPQSPFGNLPTFGPGGMPCMRCVRQHVVLRVSEWSRPMFVMEAKRLVAASKREPGCIDYGLFQDRFTNDYAIIATWASLNHFMSHYWGSAAVRQFRNSLARNGAENTQTRIYTPVA